ncbi:MAG: sensor histidine kinase [Anaerolineales bacterium]|nr:sensor histidine kinase [Anaerolineales bacterium]
MRKPFLGLSWKLTLSYTLVTVATWLVIEIVLIAGVSFLLIYSNLIPSTLIYAMDTFIAPQVADYLDQPQADVESMKVWMESAFADGITFESPENPNITFHLGDLDQNAMLIVLDQNLNQLAGIPSSDDLKTSTFNQDTLALLEAAQIGETNPGRISNISGGLLTTALPVFNGNGEVLGIILMIMTYPPPGSLVQTLSLIGVSLIIFTLAAGMVGTVFGYFTARGLTGRLRRISSAAKLWSQGDFSAFIQDRSTDELSQLAQQLNRMAEQLQHLLKTKQDLATLEERNRLARDLHDSVKQQVFATTMQIGAAKAVLDQDSEKMMEHLDQAEQLSRQAQAELGSLIRELRPVTLSAAGLIPALEEFGRDWSQQNAVDLEFMISEIPELRTEVEQALFRVTQEGLSNVSRHSQATRVKIKLYTEDTEIVLTIIDNGQGFDLSDVDEDGIGLSSMQERMQAVGGQLQIESCVGRGTQITTRCPITEGG